MNDPEAQEDDEEPIDSDGVDFIGWKVRRLDTERDLRDIIRTTPCEDIKRMAGILLRVIDVVDRLI